MNKVAFTIVNDEYYYPAGCHIFVNSFKRFHPDIPLVVFRQNTIDKTMVGDINFYNSKPTFARLLTDKYDLIANIDCDHIITARLTGVFDEVDYEVACPTNLNDYENASFDNITKEMYLQGGMVASTSKRFWDEWEEANKLAHVFIRKENDVMNKVIYDSKYQLKILDKDSGYYGCKSLNREQEFYLEGKKVMCRGEQVYAYHWAKGKDLPKMQWDRLPFTYEVKTYLKYLGDYGQTVTIL